MKVVARDGAAVLVDMEKEALGVHVGVVVRGTSVSPLLPYDKITEAGMYDQPVKPGERDRVLARVAAADPQPGF